MKRRVMTVAALAALGAVLGTTSPALAQFGRKLPPPPPPPAGPPPPGPNDWRTPDPDNLLVIDTNKGRIIAELAPSVAPGHVARIKELARRHFYDGQEFFRVIENFMDQTGDPKNDGTGGSDLPNLKAEIMLRRAPGDDFVSPGAVLQSEAGYIGSMPMWSQLSLMAPLTADGKVNAWTAFCPGVLGAARATDPDSANSQFFLMRDAYPGLEKSYTGFGRVLVGQNVVKAIKVGEPPEPPRDTLTTVRLASDLPEAQRPKIRVVDTKSAWFKARLAETFADRGLVFTPCAVDPPVEVR